MKEVFAEFYQPNEDELATLMQKGIIVLDANVLLNPYNVANEGREALLALLEKIQDRLWVPYQAALEFQRNRVGAISGDHKKLLQALTSTQQGVATIIGDLRKLDLDRRGIGKVSDKIEASFKAARDLAEKSLKEAQQGQLGVGPEDPVRERLDKILDGRIGPPPSSQEELDAIFQDGEQRYALQIPPGFEDKSKDDHRYHHAGLTYKAKFGDLILWKQTIAHAFEAKLENVVLVTLDRKRDWWLLQESGEILGPLPNLISEMGREGGVKLFWLLHLPDFMSQANKHLSSTISEIAIDQVVASDRPIDQQYFGITQPEGNSLRTMTRDLAFAGIALSWLQNISPGASFSSSPGRDIVMSHNGERVAVELLVLHGWQNIGVMLQKIRISVTGLDVSLMSHGFDSGILVVDCDGNLIPLMLQHAVRSMGRSIFPAGRPISVQLGFVSNNVFNSLVPIDFRRAED